MKRVALHEICELKKGRKPDVLSGEQLKGWMPYILIQSFDGSRTSFSNDKKCTECTEDDTLIVTDGARSGLASFGHAGYIGSTIAALVPNKEEISPRFLYYFVHGHFDLLNTRTKGATIPHLDKTYLMGMTLSLPPLPEQERIVRLLDEAEQVRKLRGQASTRMEEFIPALFHEMFGDVVPNDKKWDKKKFSQLGQLDRGKSKHRPRDAAFLYGGKYPFVQTGDIANSDGQITTYSQTYSEEGLAQSKLWSAGTLCITIAANIGKTAILTFPACFPDSIVGFTPDTSLVDVEYIRQWVVTIEDDLDSIAPQSAQKNINLGILRELDVPLPPLDLQREFARRVSEARAVQSVQRRSEERVEALYQSMLARAFGGEL